jgi:hypothetical protein
MSLKKRVTLDITAVLQSVEACSRFGKNYTVENIELSNRFCV